MRFSAVLMAGVALSLGACSSGTGGLVVDGPNAPPEKPAVTPYVPVEETMDDFITAAGSNTVLFETDSSQLDGDARDTLDRQAAWLVTHRDLAVLIEGNTDLRASEAYNKGLGRRRAEAVVDYLVGKGVSRLRFTARSFGEGTPIVNKGGDVQINRRAVTVVLDALPEGMSPYVEQK